MIGVIVVGVLFSCLCTCNLEDAGEERMGESTAFDDDGNGNGSGVETKDDKFGDDELSVDFTLPLTLPIMLKKLRTQ